MKTLFQATKYKFLELCIDYICEKLRLNFSDQKQLLKAGKFYSMIEAPYTSIRDNQKGIVFFDCVVTSVGIHSFIFNYGSYLLKEDFVGERGYKEEGEGATTSFPLDFIKDGLLILTP